MVEKQVWVASVGLSERKVRGKRGPQTERFAHEYPVRIRAVSEAETDHAFDARIGLHRYEYRTFEGQLYRPVMAPGGAPAGGVEIFEQRRLQLAEMEAGERRANSWFDNPFARALQFRADAPLYEPEHMGKYENVGGEPISDDRADVEMRGAAMATELLEIGGRLYRRAPEPVWVAIERGPYTGVRDINLIMPDHSEVMSYDHDWRGATFRFDQKDAAIAYAAEVEELVRIACEKRGMAYARTVTRVAADEVFDVNPDYSPSADVERMTVHAFATLIDYSLGAPSIERVPLSYLKAAVSVRALMETAADARPDVADALDAFGDVIRVELRDPEISPRIEMGLHQARLYPAWRSAVLEQHPDWDQEKDFGQDAAALFVSSM